MIPPGYPVLCVESSRAAVDLQRAATEASGEADPGMAVLHGDVRCLFHGDESYAADRDDQHQPGRGSEEQLGPTDAGVMLDGDHRPPFRLIYWRSVLMHVVRKRHFLRTMWGLLEPGGLLLFKECVFVNSLGSAKSAVTSAFFSFFCLAVEPFVFFCLKSHLKNISHVP